MLEQLNFIKPNDLSSVGHQLLFPSQKFNCFGYVVSWSAYAISNIQLISPHFLTHTIIFQIWRRIDSERDIVYRLIGSDVLRFNSMELRILSPDPNPGEVVYVGFYNKTGKSTEPLYFEPGDIVGCFVPSRIQTSRPPLGIVYRVASPSNFTSDGSVLDSSTICVTHTAVVPCEVSFSQCSDVQCITGAMPIVSIDYREFFCCF